MMWPAEEASTWERSLTRTDSTTLTTDPTARIRECLVVRHTLPTRHLLRQRRAQCSRLEQRTWQVYRNSLDSNLRIWIDDLEECEFSLESRNR